MTTSDRLLKKSRHIKENVDNMTTLELKNCCLECASLLEQLGQSITRDDEFNTRARAIEPLNQKKALSIMETTAAATALMAPMKDCVSNALNGVFKPVTIDDVLIKRLEDSLVKLNEG